MAYTPKYVSLDDVPVQIPDDYTDSEKEDALELAEATLEADINEGNAIPVGDVSVLIKAAVKQKATCELAKGAEDPDDVALGDLADDGSTKVDYAFGAFCDNYDEIVDKILSSETWSDTGGTSLDPYVYNTDKPDDSCSNNTWNV